MKNRRGRLARRLTTWILLIALIPLLLSALLTAYDAVRFSNDMAQSRQEGLVSLGSTYVNNYVNSLLLDLRSAAELGVKSPEQAQAALSALCANSLRLYRELTIADENGQELYRLDNCAAVPLVDLTNRAQAEEFFRAKRGETFLGPTTFAENNEPVMKLSVGAGPENGPKRVIMAQINLQDLWQPLSALEAGQGAYAYIVDRRGTVIGASDFELVKRNISQSTAPTVFPLIDKREGVLGARYLGLLNDDVIGSSAPIGNTGWGLVIEQPTGDAQSLGGSLTVSFLVLIGVVTVGTVIAAVLISRSIVRPINQLAASAEKLSSGDLDTRVTIATKDEIELVGEAFNTMAGRLQNLVGSLEAQIEARTQQLQASADVGRTAAALLDADELLDRVVNLITERFDFYYTAIFLVDAAGDNAVLRAATGEAGRILKDGGHKLPLSLDSMVAYAISKRKPRVALDVGKDAVHFANPLLPDTRSEIALPLMVGQETLGALDVQSERSAAFDEASIAVLQSMANQIAVALFNARSFEKVQKSLEYSERQFEVSRELFAAITPSDAYIAMGQVWVLLPEIDHLQIFLVAERDPNGQPARYELMMDWDIIGGVQVDVGQIYAVADVPIIQLGQADQVRVIQDVNHPQVPRQVRLILRDMNVQAALLIPLRIRGEYEGIIVASAERPVDFSDAVLNLVTAMTDQLAVVLSNLQLTKEMQETVRRVELLNRRLSAEAWQRYLADQVVTAESGQPAPATALNRLEVPIQVRGQAIGRFALEDANADRAWNTEELSLFQTVANEVALAVDNARLIEQTRRAAQRDKDIASAADKIHRASDLEEILQTAVSEINRITGLPDVAIQFGAAPSNGSEHHV